ncbi:MAG: endonuclease [bacterium]
MRIRLSGTAAPLAAALIGAAAGVLLATAGALAETGWQAVALSDTVVSFGAVATGGTHSLALSIVNDLEEPVQVTEADFDEAVFSTDLAGMVPFEIPAQSSQGFHVYFSSAHNINYTDFLRIRVEGAIRPLVAEVSAQAQYPDTYYAATQNKWAEDLKDALTAIIDDHTSLGYNLARDSMYGSIDNVGGWVTCVYTGRTAFFNTRAGATANGFNCEHTWPQSFSNEAEPMRSDIFHLYATDETANNKRADLDFGVVTTVSWTVGGSKLGTDAYGQTVFEPRAVHKGNVARSHFYYVIRYNGAYNQYVNPAKMEAHFRAWHVSDPVDSAEQARNQHIYTLQHNRNPFIDHPELADRISSFFGVAVRALEPEIAVAPGEADLGSIGFDTTACYYLAMANTGTDTLHVSSITSSNPAFDLGAASLALAPETYAYVEIAYQSGASALHDSTVISVASDDDDEPLLEVLATVEVGDCAGTAWDVPPSVRLYQNRPNPFARATTIPFELDRDQTVSLGLYDVKGRLVREILSGEPLPAGEHRAEVTGRFSPGVYYYRLATADQVLTKRMLVLDGSVR